MRSTTCGSTSAYSYCLGLLQHGMATVAVMVLAACVSSEPQRCEGSPSPKPVPNIVFILADDLGYAELGCYGQEKIETPNIDRLAADGMRFTQHYCGAPVCAPSRCVLMTGKHLGHAYIRNNKRAKLPQEILDRYAMEFHGQEPIPESELTIAEILKAKGYATGAVGKWGLGHFGTSGDPNRQGFDLFFGYNCQGHAHSYYPAYLWRNDKKVPLANDPPIPGHASLPEGADPDDPASYDMFKGADYAPDHMLEAALGFVRKNQQGPFFLYYPSPIPHVALHIPDDEVKPYLGRWQEKPFTREDGYGYTPHYTPRAAYAAMITRLDKEVGRILALLDELGLRENTLVLFSSDNGTTHLDKEVDYEFFDSVGPLRGLKGSVYEGGIRVPMIARWPGRIEAGSVTDHVSAFYDVLPTLCEVAGCPIPPETDGISFLPTLLGRDDQRQHEFLLWEFYGYGGQQAVRLGDWKGVRQKCNRDPDGPIELYNLKTDLGEQRNVAAEHPEIVERIEQIMRREHSPSALFRFGPRR